MLQDIANLCLVLLQINYICIKISFPVGRVEYYYLHPVNFQELLIASGEKQSIELLNIIPIPEFAHYKLSNLFKTYTLIGGMPGIIDTCIKKKDINILSLGKRQKKLTS